MQKRLKEILIELVDTSEMDIAIGDRWKDAINKSIIQILQLFRDEVVRMKINKEEKGCNCYACKFDYGNCVTDVRNNTIDDILKKLK